MPAMTKIALITSAALGLNGCATMAYPWGDQPRSQERQARSDACWGMGSDNAGVYLATLVFKPVVCMANDLTQGQPQVGSGEPSRHTYITPAGTFTVISTPGLTTVTQTAK